MLGHIEEEIEHLEAKAHALVADYYRFAKASGRFLKLRVRVRRHNGSLQIEWTIPSWLFYDTDAKIRSRHLAKGTTESYPAKRLVKHVPPEFRKQVLGYEKRFAEIRKAARLLSQMKRLAKQYEQQLTKVEGGEENESRSFQGSLY
jgi:hypothetical protein